MVAGEGKLRCGPGETYQGVWLCVLTVALLQGLYSIGFIARTSFIVEGQRYFCLFDDAMISMRYAANWANGNGFVWNCNEPVEGYTTFLWTAIMGLCHLPGLSPGHTCLIVQVLGVLILWLCLVATALLAKSADLDPILGCLAVVLTGTYYNLIFFSLFGMETGLLTALVTFAFADSISCIRNRRANLHVTLWLAPIVLVRPDTLPVMLICAVSVIVFAARARKLAIAGLAIAVFILLLHLLWRHSFYGQWLPNTYYLKMTGWPLAERIRPGIEQSILTIVTLALPIALASIALLKRGYHRFLLFGGLLLSIGYQTCVGGDAWPLSRFVIPFTPGLFVLAAEGMAMSATLLTKKLNRLSGIISAGLLLLLCILNINVIHWDHYFLLTRPQTVEQNWMNIRYVHAVAKVTDADVTSAVLWGGTFPYFFRCQCVDLLGKCDSRIARLTADREVNRAGHNKSDILYSINTYHPDVFVHVPDGRVAQQLLRNYTPVAIEVDGEDMMFCVRSQNSKVRIVRRVSWLQYADWHYVIDRKSKAFRTAR